MSESLSTEQERPAEAPEEADSGRPAPEEKAPVETAASDPGSVEPATGPETTAPADDGAVSSEAAAEPEPRAAEGGPATPADPEAATAGEPEALGTGAPAAAAAAAPEGSETSAADAPEAAATGAAESTAAEAAGTAGSEVARAAAPAPVAPTDGDAGPEKAGAETAPDGDAGGDADRKGRARKAKKRAKKARAAQEAKAPPVPDTPEIAALRKAKNERREVEGRVIGWNSGGFHVVVDTVTAFCPRSEMEPGGVKEPQSYLDQTFPFLVLRIQKKAKRVVVSRLAALRLERSRLRSEVREKISAGSVLDGRIASLTDFGAFVDLGGVQGLVHVSEIRRERVEKPEEVLAVGQEVRVKVLKVEQGGKRISLSMKALEPDPWKGVKDRFSEGAVVDGVVEKVASFGAFVALEPGLTGLLPTASMTLPRGSSAARLFPPGKKVSVQILRVDPRRRRISLALEGSKLEGSRSDYESYVKGQERSGGGFNALAAALEKLRPPQR